VNLIKHDTLMRWITLFTCFSIEWVWMGASLSSEEESFPTNNSILDRQTLLNQLESVAASQQREDSNVRFYI
jgi:hypothetical protein